MKPDAFELEIVTVGENGIVEADVLVHDEKNHLLASMLAALQPPAFPMALGVIYCDPAPGYETNVTAQIEEAKANSPAADLNALMRQGHTWTVKG
jgi:2-oxoglutarate ferredoxin oxidoreductase subunit beta